MTGQVVQRRSNADIDWDRFDPDWYLEHNYAQLRGDDRELLERISTFFADVRPAQLGAGIDAGSGTNLYPALAMLPLCHHITLWERAKSNCHWLDQQILSYGSVWDQYWNVLKEQPGYHSIGADARAALEARAVVERDSIFNLPHATYDVGTMFFVAESITDDRREFVRATRRFIRSLSPNAPFAAAFMRNSRGYWVKGSFFPAVAIDEHDVADCLEGVARHVTCHVVGRGVRPLRKGYEGMILATGFAPRRVDV